MQAYWKFFGLLFLVLSPFFVAVWAALRFLDGNPQVLVAAPLVLTVLLGMLEVTDELPRWYRLATRLVVLTPLFALLWLAD